MDEEEALEVQGEDVSQEFFSDVEDGFSGSELQRQLEQIHHELEEERKTRQNLQEELSEDEKEIFRLEKEIQAWHQHILSIKDIDELSLIDPVIKEQMEQLTYHLKRESQGRLKVEQKLHKVEEELAEKDAQLAETEEELEKAKERLKEGEEQIIYSRAKLEDMQEKFLTGKKIKANKPTSPFSGKAKPSLVEEQSKHRLQQIREKEKKEKELRKEMELSDIVDEHPTPANPTREKPKRLFPTKTQKPAKKEDKKENIDEELQESKRLLKLVLRVGTVKSNDASLLLNVKKNKVLAWGRLLAKKKMMTIHHPNSRDPLLRASKTLLRRMEEIKKSSGKPPSS